MADQHRVVCLEYELSNALAPRAVIWMLRIGHPWGSHPIGRPESVSEQRLPIDFAPPASGFTGTLDNQYDLRSHQYGVRPGVTAFEASTRPTPGRSSSRNA